MFDCKSWSSISVSEAASFQFVFKWCFQFLGEMGPDFSPKMAVKSLTSQQIVRIHQLFRQAKFDDPSGDVRSSVRLIIVFLFLLFTNYQYTP